jgi:hypothetical protein
MTKNENIFVYTNMAGKMGKEQPASFVKDIITQ